MEVERIRGELAGTRFADVRWVAETGSTNADLLALAAEGAPEGIVLVADHQHAGRGRLGRSWEAPAGSSLLVSILTRPSDAPVSLPLDEVHLVPTAVAVAAVDACAEVAGVAARLKWPNDLVVEAPPPAGDHGGAGGTRKLAGLLAESVIESDHVTALVVGIGLNVNWPESLPPDLAEIAVALNHVTGEPVSRSDVLVLLLRLLDEWYGELHAREGRSSLVHRMRGLSATIGRRVRVELAGGAVVGDAVDITAAGHLVVAVDGTGEHREIAAGDVVHLRDAEV